MRKAIYGKDWFYKKMFANLSLLPGDGLYLEVKEENSFIHSPFGQSQARHLLCSEGFAVLPYSIILRATHLTQFGLVKHPDY
ncbi:hypothetical protein GF324_11940 [bacterium]|nr:hypothetical protein [bacterium]